MLKDIIKIAHKNGIYLKNNLFVCNDSEVKFNEFIWFINKRKFSLGIEEAIKISKKELFNSHFYSGENGNISKI